MADGRLVVGTAKALAKQFLPMPAIERVKALRHAGAIRAARRVLAEAPPGPARLDPNKYTSLRIEYPRFEFVCGGGTQVPDSAASSAGGGATSAGETPALERVRAMAPLLNPLRTGQLELLEVGAGHGEAAALLAGSGHSVTAIDPCVEPLPPVVERAGIRVLEMNALALDFPADAFDAAYSINAFEHIEDPVRALGEMARVVRPGGRVVLDFAPIYHSPWGLHAWVDIGLPYVQVLFDEPFIRSLVPNNDSLWDLNGWSYRQYRELFESDRDGLRLLRLDVGHEYDHLDLIRRYPSCFASQSRDLDAFTASRLRYVGEVI
jgi:ubiquinone/menaquinone biosynthesis C-methylase UbiE